MNECLFDFIRITENAAICSAKWIGKGNERAADQAAVESMRNSLNNLAIEAVVVIGEGERDQAPMLYIGEKLGKGGKKWDIAVDPLEGTTICANSGDGALSVILFGEKDSLISAPDVYMDKIAINADSSECLIDVEDKIENNLSKLADFKACKNSDLKVTILNRDRHIDLISKIRNIGAKIKLIGDGDISAVIEVALGKSDMYVGIGGAPEGVIAAAALKVLGGQMQSKLLFSDEASKIRAKNMGIIDLNRKYNLNDLVKSNIVFCATGVTDGNLLKGVSVEGSYQVTNSMIIDSLSRSIRYITTKNPL